MSTVKVSPSEETLGVDHHQQISVGFDDGADQGRLGVVVDRNRPDVEDRDLLLNLIVLHIQRATGSKPVPSCRGSTNTLRPESLAVVANQARWRVPR